MSIIGRRKKQQEEEVTGGRSGRNIVIMRFRR